MSDTIRYYDLAGGTTVLSTQARFVDGDELDVWHVSPVYDAMMGVDDLFVDYELGKFDITLRFAIDQANMNAARATLSAWRKTFMRDVSLYSPTTKALGTLEIVSNGGTYWKEVSVSSPDIDGPHNGFYLVTMNWATKSPFWNLGTEQSIGTTFAGTASVSVSWDNTGDFETWPTHVITGAMGTPRITNNTTGNYLEIGTSWAGSADQVWIWTDDPLIRYYAGGTAAGTRSSGDNWTKYAGTVSRFDAFQVSAGSVTLTAASGSAAYAANYHILTAGLGTA